MKDRTDSISVVIPTYNEAGRIRSTIEQVILYISQFNWAWEIVIADDGSTDQTLDIVRNYMNPNIRILENEVNKGKGAVVKQGMLHASGKLVLFIDADNSTPICEVEKLLNHINNEGYDIAIGSREIDGSFEKRGLIRLFISKVFRKIVFFVLPLKIHDTQCGFKLFRKEVVENIFPEIAITGFMFDVEVLMRAAGWGYQIIEVPIEWMEARGSKVQVGMEIFRHLRDLIIIYIRYRQGKYERG